MPPARAAEILITNSGTQFHPDVVNAFIKVLKRKNINTQKGKWKTMLIEGIIIGIVTGYLRGGRLRRLANLNLKAYYLLFIAVIIEITLNYVLINHRDIILEAYSLIVVVIQYLLIFVFVGLNLNKPYTWLIGTGVLLNFIVIVANFGAMPVSSQILSLASPSKKMTLLGEGKFYTYKLVESGVLLWF